MHDSEICPKGSKGDTSISGSLLPDNTEAFSLEIDF